MRHRIRPRTGGVDDDIGRDGIARRRREPPSAAVPPRADQARIAEQFDPATPRLGQIGRMQRGDVDIGAARRPQSMPFTAQPGHLAMRIAPVDRYAGRREIPRQRLQHRAVARQQQFAPCPQEAAFGEVGGRCVQQPPDAVVSGWTSGPP